VDDAPGHVREAEVPAAVLVGELFVVDPHEVEDRGVQVVSVDGVLDCLEGD